MGRRTRMLTPTQKAPVFPVEVRRVIPTTEMPREWTVAEALELLRSGYSLPRVVSRTGKDPAHLRELALAHRVQIREN